MDTQDADWLVIDDVSLPDQGASGGSVSLLKERFDSFIIDRLNSRKPTILVCNFDINKHSIIDKMGFAFHKIVTAENTCCIRV